MHIVASGMKAASYIYVNIDDAWEGERDANGVLHSNEKFPDMKGIYTSPEPKTCAHFEGSLGHEEQDAQLYADEPITLASRDIFLGRVASPR